MSTAVGMSLYAVAEIYESLAEFCVRNEANPIDVIEELRIHIEANPHHFNRRMADYAYARAMPETDED